MEITPHPSSPIHFLSSIFTVFPFFIILLVLSIARGEEGERRSFAVW
jgi:hypothetical protein